METPFQNPTPVVVGLIPVITDKEGRPRIGVLAIRRTAAPFVGGLALPGGYLEIEGWQEGLTREVREETGLELKAPLFAPFDLASVRENRILLVFARYLAPLIESTLPPHVANSEASERQVLHDPSALVFPAHETAARRFLERLPVWP